MSERPGAPRRRRPPARSGLTLALVALAGTAVLGAPVAAASTKVAAAPATAGHTVVLPRIPDCGGKLVLRPKSFVLACADANAYLTSIRWSSWAARGATGAATFVLNDCAPNCAAGRFHRYAATARLSRPKATKHGVLFSLVQVAYRSGASTKHYSLDLASLPIFAS